MTDKLKLLVDTLNSNIDKAEFKTAKEWAAISLGVSVISDSQRVAIGQYLNTLSRLGYVTKFESFNHVIYAPTTLYSPKKVITLHA